MAVFRWADFEERVRSAERAALPGLVLPAVILTVGLSAFSAVWMWMPGVDFWVLAIVVVAFFASGIWAVTRSSRKARRLGLICPKCGASLFGSAGKTEPLKQDRVFETGLCPQCREQILDPLEIGPSKRDLSLRELLLGVCIIAVLALSLVGMSYFGKRADARWASCKSNYAAALTATDTARVDQHEFRYPNQTCGDLRETTSGGRRSAGVADRGVAR